MIQHTLNISWQCYDDIVYITDERMHYIYTLDETSALFWNGIISGLPKDEICKQVVKKYTGVSYTEVEDDFSTFIHTLKRMEFLEDSHE